MDKLTYRKHWVCEEVQHVVGIRSTVDLFSHKFEVLDEVTCCLHWCCEIEVLVFQSDADFSCSSEYESVASVRWQTKSLHFDIGAICQVPKELAALIFGIDELSVIKC